MVLDTSVLVAGLRSWTGASNLLLEYVLAGQIKPLLSVPLILEYEEVLKRPDQLLECGLSADQIDSLLFVICTEGIQVNPTYRWRPQLSDPGDEMVLETAVNGSARAIVTHNRRDFVAGAARFGIEVFSPGEAWERVKRR
jgi:putative PIN family toxin of toxin-antitoxin system